MLYDLQLLNLEISKRDMPEVKLGGKEAFE